MERIALVFPESRPNAVECAKRTAAFLLERQVEICVLPEHLQMIPGTMELTAQAQPTKYIAIGGDGTLLRAAKSAYRQGAPLFGINSGSLGFLTEIDPSQLEPSLERILVGDYTLDERMLLSATVAGEGRWRCVNDAILTRAGYARLIGMRVLVNGELAGEYRADGLIVATPTGSTGYSLSAGGPVVGPHVDCLTITPVCAHTLQHRPLVVNGNSFVRIELKSDSEMRAMLQADGRNCCSMRAGGAVDIKRTTRTLKLIRLDKLQFYDRVQHKLADRV